MKFSLVLVAVLVVFAAAAEAQLKPEPKDGAKEEGILDGIKEIGKGLGHAALKGLKEIGKTVGKDLIDKTAQILTDHLHLHPTKEAQQALGATRSTEGIINATSALIFKRAQELALEHVVDFPSHEGIVADYGPYFKVYDAQNYLYYQYNKSYHDDSFSHEGILGNLGGLAFKGLGKLVGGQFGNILGGAGDLLGSLFFAVPQPTSQEGIIKDLGAGILTSSGQLVVKGAATAAKTLLKGIFKPISDMVHATFFLQRGAFNGYGYSSIEEPGKEALAYARAHILQHPQAKHCVEVAEKNLTQLFEHYMKNGHGCVAAGKDDSKKIIANVFDIIIDAVGRVEDAHREAGYCFEKHVEENKVRCIEHEIPARIQEHKRRFCHYGTDLANYVKQFSDLNTQFDVCLIRHLGDIRREVYNVIYEFHDCVEHHPSSTHSHRKQTGV